MADGNGPDVGPTVRRSDVRTRLIAVLLLLAIGSAARAGIYHLSDPALLWQVYGGPALTPNLKPDDPAVIKTKQLVHAARQFNLLPEKADGMPGRLAMLRSLMLEPERQLEDLS